MMSIQLTPEAITEDIKLHRIKEGWMAKKSRFLRQWRERWIVLTKDYMYSFQHKQVYTKPTQILPICDIQTLKSYFKQQQEKEFSFRAENKNVNFYLAGKTNTQKWAWMTAIERAIDRNHNGTVDDKEKVIEKMRNTYLAKEKENQGRPSLILAPTIKKQLTHVKLEKIRIDPISSTTLIKSSQNLQPSKIENIVIKATAQSPQKTTATSVQEKAKQFQSQGTPKVEQKIVQKIVQVVKIVEVEKIVQKIVKVPEIVEKIVYESKPENQQKNQPLASLNKQAVIDSLFNDILSSPVNFGFLVKFLVSLSLEEKLSYSNSIVRACLVNQNGRYFSEALLIVYNQQTDEDFLNQILKFILQIYEQTEQYFYITDLKVLIDILCRELELYRSDVNHYLMLQLIKNLCIKETWQKLQGYRVKDLKNLVEEINGLTSSSANKDLTKELMQYL